MTITPQLLESKKFYQNQIFSGVAFVFALLIVALVWFLLVHSVRIKELRYRLKAANNQNTSVRTMSLVSRYKLLRQSDMDSNRGESYIREGHVMQILADTVYLNETDELNLGERLAKFSIDLFDWISGTPPYRHESSSREHRILERAFYHEITRNYKEAISQYDGELDGLVSNRMRPYTLLHRGFCQAIGGNRAKAVQDFQEVIRSTTDTEYTDTAKALLAMLAEINNAILQINAMPESIEKAASYYNITAYEQAISTLKAIPQAKDNPEAMYYLARSLEETGNTKQAVDIYRKAITKNPNVAWAKKANRRIFALGAFYAAGKQYRTESKGNVQKGIIHDTELLTDAARFEKVSEQIDSGERQMVATLLDAPKIEEKFSIADITEHAMITLSEQAKQSSRLVKINRGPDWAALELLPRAEKIDYIGKYAKIEKIILEDGNQFRGIVIAENKARIFLFTALGKVVIIKSRIQGRETIAP